ncbi:hypothetical protein HUU05_13065, partial [candidate division KSB1 bacterium]|nr:hypothetical protein [candidate division KSB1 bacterium]
MLKLSFKILFFALAVIGFVPVLLHAQGVSVVTTVDRARIGLNEDFTLSVEISGRDAGEP